MKKISTIYLILLSLLGFLILIFLIFNSAYLIFSPYLNPDFQPKFSNNTGVIQGEINSLPLFKPHHQIQFDFKTIHPSIGVLNCHWYGLAPKLTPGDIWVLTIKPKSWQTLTKIQKFKNNINPDFNYGLYLISHQYSGSCSVLSHAPYSLVQHAHYFNYFNYLNNLNYLRSELRDLLWTYIKNLTYHSTMMALVLGDRSGLTQEDWDVLRNTGTNHLVAIAGLHIALIVWIGFFLAWNLLRQFKLLGEWGWVPRISLIFSWLVGLIYSAMAGFSVPTQRALIMLSVYIYGQILGFRFNPYFAWSLAAVLIILINPWSLLDAGIWLSFTAVFFLIYGYQQYKPKGFWREFIYPQWFIFIGLIPISLYWFSQFSTIGFFTNFLAIPYLFFIILPLLLLSVLGVLFLLFFKFIFLNFLLKQLFIFINFLIFLLWKFLKFNSNLPYSHFLIHTPHLIFVISGTLGAMILLTPRYGYGYKRLIGLFLFLSVFI